MENFDMSSLPITTMSPGLDGWRQEQRSSMLPTASMHPCSSVNFDLNLSYRDRDNRREKISEKEDNRRVPVSHEKAIRSFKFALVEFFKEELKPYYDGGKLSRGAHKIIIKKSMSKVIETCGTCGIPETDKAIKVYLRSSQSKLSKLVKAYVEKYQMASS